MKRVKIQFEIRTNQNEFREFEVDLGEPLDGFSPDADEIAEVIKAALGDMKDVWAKKQ